MTMTDSQHYWEQRLSKNFNDKGVGDIGLPESYNHYLYQIRKLVFKRAVSISALQTPDAKILDVGSGTGFYIKNWLALGAKQLEGSDITRVAVDNLRHRFPSVRFTQADIGDNNSQWQSDSFDCISTFDVLFHITDDTRYSSAINNIANILKPNGTFLYSDNLIRKPFNVNHQVGRTEASILQNLNRAGFRIMARIPMFVLMNDPVRSESKLLKKSFSTIYRIASMSSSTGRILGMALYPLETALTKLVKNGPSTEVLICQKTQNTRT